MDISEVGQICVPLISVGREGKAGRGLGEVERDAREPFPFSAAPIFLGSPPKWGCFATEGGIPSLSQKTGAAPGSRQEENLAFVGK